MSGRSTNAKARPGNYRSRVSPAKFEFARQMREHPTPQEAKMWTALQNPKNTRLKWRRQHVMLGWIVDFYCPSARLIVELDGSYHDPAKDAIRDRVILEKLGFRTIRFFNSEVDSDINAVLRKIHVASQSGSEYASRSHQSECATSVLAGTRDISARRPPAPRTKPVNSPLR